MLDFTAPPGVNYYFKCPFLREITDDAIRVIIEAAGSAPTEQSQVILEHMHGAASRVPATQTAFGLRRVHYSINIVAGWTDVRLPTSASLGPRGLSSQLESFGASDAYVNYLGEEGAAAVRASYGVNYARLAQSKQKYDPQNLFCSNQNIAPSA